MKSRKGKTAVADSKCREEIRKYSWVLLVLSILGLFLLSGLALFLGTLNNLFSSWPFYASTVVIIVYLIGLFSYKKWGFYLFTVYLAYLLLDNLVRLNFTGIFVTAIVYGYLIWYRGLYMNRSCLE